MVNCIFCEIIQGERTSVNVFETKNILSFMDKYPINRGHLLVIPKQHYDFLTDMSDDEVSELFKIVNLLSKSLWKSVAADGISIGQSNGKAASQDIFHVHVHIIPRFVNDSVDGSWPTRKIFAEKELQDTATLIKTHLP